MIRKSTFHTAVTWVLFPYSGSLLQLIANATPRGRTEGSSSWIHDIHVGVLESRPSTSCYSVVAVVPIGEWVSVQNLCLLPPPSLHIYVHSFLLHQFSSLPFPFSLLSFSVPTSLPFFSLLLFILCFLISFILSSFLFPSPLKYIDLKKDETIKPHAMTALADEWLQLIFRVVTCWASEMISPNFSYKSLL